MPSDISFPGQGREEFGSRDAASSPSAIAQPLPPRRAEPSLAEFHTEVGRTVHMLNNLLTALYCQWDLSSSEAADSRDPAALLKKTVDLMADALMSAVGGAGTYVVLGSLFAITAALGLFISNTATAVLMAPVALAIAKDLYASPYPFAMIVALAASTAFMTPVSSPVNTLVVTPGNYTFGDFVKVGVPFSFVVMIVCVLMVPLLLPL